MSGKTAEAWQDRVDETADSDMAAATKGLSDLNVNACPFIPGQNVFVQPFVPSAARADVTNEG